jgi:succinate dehydrogenase flavin-adding protein (antitoxin of CptAB toxin-antitoxin module)
MISMANKTISKHIEGLNESEKKEFNQLLSVDDTELEPKYSTIKESVVERLNTMYNQNHDNSTRNAINETIEKLSTEKYDKLNYYKLKSLYENL